MRVFGRSAASIGRKLGNACGRIGKHTTKEYVNDAVMIF